MWDIRCERAVQHIRAPSQGWKHGMLTSLSFRACDVAAGFESGVVLQFDIRNFEYADYFLLSHNSDRCFVSSSYSSAITHVMHSTQPVLALDISPNRCVCCGGADGAISIGQLSPCEEPQIVECPPPILISTGTRGNFSDYHLTACLLVISKLPIFHC
jgi:hypothetical protein